MFLTLKKMFFLWGCFGIFHVLFFNFLIEKLWLVFHTRQWVGSVRVIQVAHVTPPGGQIVICHLPVCAAMSSTAWYGAYRLMVVGLSPVTKCFCFFFLFSLLTVKVYNCPPLLLFFNFNPYSLNFLFCPYFFYRSSVFLSILSFNYNVVYVFVSFQSSFF